VVDSSLGLVYRYGMKIAGAAASSAHEAISVCGGPSTSPGIMRRIAAIWNRPAIQAGQAGAALGAAVAAAVALVPEAEREGLAEHLRQAIFTGKAVVQPEAELVRAYHAPGVNNTPGSRCNSPPATTRWQLPFSNRLAASGIELVQILTLRLARRCAKR
jgi:hypothetical protein